MKIGNRPIRNTTREEVMNNRFGTTSDMIIQTVQEKEGCACLAIDEKGLYLTSPAYVDRPLADPNRYAGIRMKSGGCSGWLQYQEILW